MSDIPCPDCTACGICCTSGALAYVRLTGEDWDRLGAEGQPYAHFIGNKAFMRMEKGACAALDWNGAWPITRAFCKIYDRRPETCRTLERGSPACAGERWAKGGGEESAP